MVIFIDFETSPKQKLFVSSQSLGSWTSINASIMTIFMAAFLTCQMVWKSLQETKRLPSLPMFPDNSYQLSSWSPLDGFHPPVEDFCRGQIATQNAIYSACFRHMFHLLGRRSIISDLFWSNYIYIYYYSAIEIWLIRLSKKWNSLVGKFMRQKPKTIQGYKRPFLPVNV